MTTRTTVHRLREAVKGLSAREQALVMLVMAMCVYVGLETFVLAPQNNQLQALMEAVDALDTQAKHLGAELESIQPEAQTVIVSQAVAHQQLKAQVEQLNDVSAHVDAGAPRLSNLVVEVLKSKHAGVILTSFTTLPVRELSLLPAGTKADLTDQRPPTLYRHGVQIEVRGSYLDLLAYVQSLESEAPTALWSDVTLRTLTYPESALRITLFILSHQSRLKLS